MEVTLEPLINGAGPIGDSRVVDMEKDDNNESDGGKTRKF